jgi:hypothetical protein
VFFYRCSFIGVLLSVFFYRCSFVGDVGVTTTEGPG